MLRRTMLALITLAAALPPAFAADEDPVAVLRELYRVHAEAEKTKVMAWMKPHQQRFFTRALGDRIERAYKSNQIDFDFIWDGQDAVIKDLAFQPGRRSGDKATVIVTFKNMDQPKRLEYSMVREGGAWRVADIRSRQKPAWVLTQVLKGR
jgi:hypothetical protein